MRLKLKAVPLVITLTALRRRVLLNSLIPTVPLLFRRIIILVGVMRQILQILFISLFKRKQMERVLAVLFQLLNLARYFPQAPLVLWFCLSLDVSIIYNEFGGSFGREIAASTFKGIWVKYHWGHWGQTITDFFRLHWAHYFGVVACRGASIVDLRVIVRVVLIS